MLENLIFHSPRIFYEIEKEGDSYGINVYFEGFENSEDSSKRCRVKNISRDIKTTAEFVSIISASCALPVHIPELARDFLFLM